MLGTLRRLLVETAPDAGTAVVLAWRRPGDAALTVRLGDLDPEARYRVRGADDVRTGKELGTEGLAIGWTWPDCAVVILDQV